MSNETTSDFIDGPFGAAIRVRSDVWYAKRLIEFVSLGEPGPRGGAPKTVQVLLTPDQAQKVLDDLTAALAAANPTPNGDPA